MEDEVDTSLHEEVFPIENREKVRKQRGPLAREVVAGDLGKDHSHLYRYLSVLGGWDSSALRSTCCPVATKKQGLQERNKPP